MKVGKSNMFRVSKDMSDNQSEQPAWYQKDWVKPEQFFSSPICPYFGINIPNPQHLTRFWSPTADCILNSNPSIAEIIQNIPAPDVCQWLVNHPTQRVPPNKAKRIRTAFTTNQIHALEDVFRQQFFICKSEREKLSGQLRLNDKAIKVWFQNRRMKEKNITEDVEMYNHNIPNVYNDIDSIVSEINNCPVHNGHVIVSPVVVDKIGEIIHRILPSNLNVVEGTEQCAENSNHINKNYATHSSENSESGIDVDYKPRDQNVNGSEQTRSYETTCSGINKSTDSLVKEKPTPDELQMLFDKHFC